MNETLGILYGQYIHVEGHARYVHYADQIVANYITNSLKSTERGIYLEHDAGK